MYCKSDVLRWTGTRLFIIFAYDNSHAFLGIFWVMFCLCFFLFSFSPFFVFLLFVFVFYTFYQSFLTNANTVIFGWFLLLSHRLFAMVYVLVTGILNVTGKDKTPWSVCLEAALMRFLRSLLLSCPCGLQ